MYYDITNLRFADSARRHGISEEDARHACWNAIRVTRLDDLLMFVGASYSGLMLEVGVSTKREAYRIVHAMPARPEYLR